MRVRRQIFVIDVDSGARQYMGRGDDPAWSPDNRLSRVYPTCGECMPGVPGAGLGWPMLMIEQQPFPSMEWAELPILPHETTRDWGRMAWRGRSGGD